MAFGAAGLLLMDTSVAERTDAEWTTWGITMREGAAGRQAAGRAPSCASGGAKRLARLPPWVAAATACSSAGWSGRPASQPSSRL